MNDALNAALLAAQATQEEFFTNVLKPIGDTVGRAEKAIKLQKTEIAVVKNEQEATIVKMEEQLSDLETDKVKKVDELTKAKLQEAEIVGAVKAIKNLIDGKA